jgi:predicted small lipoprotein YifL
MTKRETWYSAPACAKQCVRDTRGTSMTALRSLLVAALLAGLVGACGVRGDLEPPPGAEQEPEDPPFILDPLVE